MPNILSWMLEDIDAEDMPGRTHGWATSASRDEGAVRGGWNNNSPTLGRRRSWAEAATGGIRFAYASNLNWSLNAGMVAGVRHEVALADSAGTDRFRLLAIQSPTDGAYRALKAQWYNGAWTDIATYDPHAAFAGSVHVFAVTWSINANGFFRFYVDGTLIGSYEGDTTVGGSAGLARFESQGYSSGTSYTAGHAWALSEVVIGDGDMRYVRGLARPPVAVPAGTHSAWTGTVTAIDDPTHSTADIISAAAAGDRESWFTSDIGATFAGMAILAVGQVSMAKKGASGPTTLHHFMRVGGVDYDGPAHALTDVYARYTDLWTTNPATGAAWANDTAVDDAEDGVLAAA